MTCRCSAWLWCAKENGFVFLNCLSFGACNSHLRVPNASMVPCGFLWLRPLSERIIAELGEGFHPKMPPSELTVKMVSRLTQMLKDVKRFKPPDGACLSPAGEYNLRCGHAYGSKRWPYHMLVVAFCLFNITFLVTRKRNRGLVTMATTTLLLFNDPSQSCSRHGSFNVYRWGWCCQKYDT